MDQPKLTRRAFLITGLAALGGAGAWWAARGLGQPGYVDDLIVRILRRNLSYLTLADADLRAFAADVTADQSVLQTRDTRLAALAYPLYPNLPDALMDDATLKPIEDDLVSRFLLSSDFFWNGADEATPVAYLGYYIPGRSPCFNPLLRPGSNAD